MMGFGCLIVIVAIVALLFGIPWLVMLAWNFLVIGFHYPMWQINYWQAFAIIFLLTVLGSFFKNNAK